MKELLKNLTFLEGIDIDQFLQHFNIVSPITVKSGDYLFHQHDIPDKFYILLEGKIKVILEKDNGSYIDLGYISTGCPIGEVSLLSEANRTASAVSETESKLIALDINDFKQKIEANDPFTLKLSYNLAKILSKRLSNSLKIIHEIEGRIRKSEISTFREKLITEGLF